MFVLSALSHSRLRGVHPDLVKVVMHAIKVTPVDFQVTDGVRTIEKQRRLVETGASPILGSRHLTGHAVDLAAYVDGELRWDWPLYSRIAKAMKMSATELDIPIEWGGDWEERDGPHFQLPWKEYPA